MNRRMLCFTAPLATITLSIVALLAACSPVPTGTTGEPDPDAVLKVANHIGLTSWDPARSAGGPELQLFLLVYDTLININAAGELKPGVAETWEFEDGASTLVLHLRKGMEFTDGTPLTAEVVEQNLERSIALPDSTLAGTMANIADVEVDGDTIRITQDQPDSGLTTLLADRPGLIVNPANFDALAADDVPNGSGPFILTDQVPAASMTFKKNQDYWNADAYQVAGMELSIIPDSTARLNAVRTGQVDLARVDPEQFEEASSASGLTVTTGPFLETMNMFFNPALEPAFADPRVRQAISLAIDREAIVEGVLFGHGIASAQYYPEGHSAHTPDLDHELTSDPERAKELLSDAGYPGGFTFEAVVYSPKSDRVAQAVQAQLAEVGITLNLDPQPGFGAAQQFSGGEVAAGIMTALPRVEPNLQWRSHFLAGQFWNPGDLEDPALSELIRASISEPDVDARRVMDREIGEFISTHAMGSVALYTVDQIIVSGSRARGVETYIDGFPYLAGISVTD